MFCLLSFRFPSSAKLAYLARFFAFLSNLSSSSMLSTALSAEPTGAMMRPLPPPTAGTGGLGGLELLDTRCSHDAASAHRRGGDGTPGKEPPELRKVSSSRCRVARCSSAQAASAACWASGVTVHTSQAQSVFSLPDLEQRLAS
jgi:hypothetical protein